jgi:hypothetical protein
VGTTVRLKVGMEALEDSEGLTEAEAVEGGEAVAV